MQQSRPDQTIFKLIFDSKVRNKSSLIEDEIDLIDTPVSEWANHLGLAIHNMMSKIGLTELSQTNGLLSAILKSSEEPEEVLMDMASVINILSDNLFGMGIDELIEHSMEEEPVSLERQYREADIKVEARSKTQAILSFDGFKQEIKESEEFQKYLFRLYEEDMEE